MLDVDKLMQASPPGSMVYARVHDGDEWRTALVIRENRKHIRALGAAPWQRPRRPKHNRTQQRRRRPPRHWTGYAGGSGGKDDAGRTDLKNGRGA